jgi:hypothetical protein
VAIVGTGYGVGDFTVTGGAAAATGAVGAAGVGRTPNDTVGIATGVGMRGTAVGVGVRGTVSSGRAGVGMAGAERAGVGTESAGWRTGVG